MTTPQYAESTPRGRRVQQFCKGACHKTRWFEIPEGSEVRNMSTTDKAAKAIKVSCLVCGYETLHFFRDDTEEES